MLVLEDAEFIASRLCEPVELLFRAASEDDSLSSS
jgi:hypothetical protein